MRTGKRLRNREGWSSVCNFLHNLHSKSVRELWSLCQEFSATASASLALEDLQRGLAIVMRAGGVFDCLPAVRAAFDYAKVFSNKGIVEDTEGKKEEN